MQATKHFRAITKSSVLIDPPAEGENGSGKLAAFDVAFGVPEGGPSFGIHRLLDVINGHAAILP